jgi:transposase
MLYAPKASTCLKAQINQRRPAMKKVSTAATKQSRNISQQRLTIGLDLGDRNSCYCVLDEAGRLQLEQRVRTTAKALREVFGAMPRSRVALEIGTHSPWISRLLSELGHEGIVANARKVRLIGENRKKDDRLDAQTLARLARIDPQLLCPVKHRSAQAQADLMMIRARASWCGCVRGWRTRRADWRSRTVNAYWGATCAT